MSERERVLQDGLGVADREERADPAAFAAFARDLDRELDDRFQDMFVAPAGAGLNGLKHKSPRFFGLPSRGRGCRTFELELRQVKMTAHGGEPWAVRRLRPDRRAGPYAVICFHARAWPSSWISIFFVAASWAPAS
jgi:hypothetical protein